MNKNKKIKPATIWISGLTASGKTTFGKFLYKDLKDFGIERVKFLDGEDLRKTLNKNYGHSLEERFFLCEKWVEVVKEENNNGNIIIISTVSHKKEMRANARREIDRFMEINLKCDPMICADRDYKNVYSTSNNDECMPGITEPYEFSSNAELIVDTENNSIKHCRKIIFKNSVIFLNNFPGITSLDPENKY